LQGAVGVSAIVSAASPECHRRLLLPLRSDDLGLRLTIGLSLGSHGPLHLLWQGGRPSTSTRSTFTPQFSVALVERPSCCIWWLMCSRSESISDKVLRAQHVTQGGLSEETGGAGCVLHVLHVHPPPQRGR